MKNIITDLWNGNISLCDQCGTQDDEIKNLVRLMERNRNALSDGLTEKQRELFEKYMDCAEDHLLRMNEQAFAEGFCFAAQLLTAALYRGE